MAIPIPVTKTRISTTNWGIPITNEVNRLTPLVDKHETNWPRVAYFKTTTPQSGFDGTQRLSSLAATTTFQVKPTNAYLVAAGFMFLSNPAEMWTLSLKTIAGGTIPAGTNLLDANYFMASTGVHPQWCDPRMIYVPSVVGTLAVGVHAVRSQGSATGQMAHTANSPGYIYIADMGLI